LSDNNQIVSAFYSTKELAVLINMSEDFVVKYRPKIIGAQRIGRYWRFDKAKINKRLDTGQSIIEGK
jgi:hypothetical protein